MKAPTKTAQESSGLPRGSDRAAEAALAELGVKIREILRWTPSLRGIVINESTYWFLWGGTGITKEDLAKLAPPIIINNNWPLSEEPLEYCEIGFLSRFGAPLQRHQLTYHGKSMSTKQRRGGKERTSLRSVAVKDRVGMYVQIVGGVAAVGSIAQVVAAAVEHAKVMLGNGSTLNLPVTSLAVWEDTPKVVYEQLVKHVIWCVQQMGQVPHEIVLHPEAQHHLEREIDDPRLQSKTDSAGFSETYITTPHGRVKLTPITNIDQRFSGLIRDEVKLTASKLTDEVERHEAWSLTNPMGHSRQETISCFKFTFPILKHEFQFELTEGPELVETPEPSEAQQILAERRKLAKWDIF